MTVRHDLQGKIEGNIKKLDYLEGEGFLRRKKRNLINQRFLVVGLGGVGNQALAKLKEILERNVEATDIKRSVRFLAIDAAHVELSEYERDGVLDPSETHRLDYVGAQALITPPLSPEVKEWVNPDLLANTTSAQHWSDKGSGQIRQVGRVRLATSVSVLNLADKISNKVTDMMHNAPAETRLRVFILTGISGGTGSGIVIDASYIIRIAAEKAIANLDAFELDGFVFLPPAAGGSDANAYAALKEIDYHMSLEDQQKYFTHSYAGIIPRRQPQNIFDVCFLLDAGSTNAGLKNPQSYARNIAAESIMNLMISQSDAHGSDNQAVFLIDSYMSNIRKAASNVVSLNPLDFPREANYKYAVVGYSKIIIPIELLVLYVANVMFERLWKLWEQGIERAKNPNEVESVLARVNLNSAMAARESIHAQVKYPMFAKTEAIHSEVTRVLGRRQKIVVDMLNDDFDQRFKQYGPYYLVKLTERMTEHLKGVVETTARQNANTSTGKEREEYLAAADLAKLISDTVLRVNNEVYEVYTTVIDAFKNLLLDATGILQDTARFKSTFGETYQWTPKEIELGKDSVIRRYLDSIIGSPGNFAKVNADEFIRVLMDKRTEWTGYTLNNNRTKSKLEIKNLDAFKVVQDFLEDYFHTMVSESIEDYLAKCYSGNPNARATVLDDNGQQVASEELKQAVMNPQGIADQIQTSHPLIKANPAKLQTFLNAGAGGGAQLANGTRFIVLPKRATHLADIIVKYPPAHIAANNVFYSDFEDGIFCYEAIGAIPTWMYEWISTGEREYANHQLDVGLHMDEGGKTNWRKLPNLYPEILWNEAGKTHFFQGEHDFMEEIWRLFAEAYNHFGLISSETKDHSIEYTAHLLGDDASVDDLLNVAVASATEELIDVTGLVSLLKSRGVVFDDAPLRIPTMEIAFDDQSWNRGMDRDQWFRQVAENSLRKMNEEIRSLHRSLEIFKELEVRIEVKNQELAKTKLALQQRPHFINYYAYQLLSTRDFGGDLQWVYRLQNGTEKVLLDTAEIEPTQLRSFGLYMAFEAFLKLPEHILNELNAVYDELSVEAKTDAGKRGAVNARKQVWKEEIESFRKAKDKTPVTPYPMSAFSFESEIKKATGDATLTQKLEEFYDDFIAAIG